MYSECFLASHEVTEIKPLPPHILFDLTRLAQICDRQQSTCDGTSCLSITDANQENDGKRVRDLPGLTKSQTLHSVHEHLLVALVAKHQLVRVRVHRLKIWAMWRPHWAITKALAIGVTSIISGSGF